MERAPLLAALVATAAVCAALLGLRALGALQFADLLLYDSQLQATVGEGRGSERVLLVLISEEDISWLDRWPMSDQDLAQALDALLAAGPRALGLDLYRNLDVPPGQPLLNQVLRRHAHHDRIVAVKKLRGDGFFGVGPPKELLGTDRFGFNDFVLDSSDDRVRRGLLFADDADEGVMFSFALRVALRYLRDLGIAPAPDPDVPGILWLGPTRIPWLESGDGGYVGEDTGGYQFMLDFRAGASGFESIALKDVLEGRVDPARLKGRALLLGSVAESLQDCPSIPLRGLDAQAACIPGVELHAHIVDQILRFAFGEARPLRSLAEWQEIALLLAVGVLGGAAGLVLRGAISSAAVLLAGLAALWFGGLAALRADWWVPMAGPGLAWISSAALVAAWVSSNERRQRALMMQLFSRHQSPAIAEQIWSQRHEFLQAGRPKSTRLIATVLFLDMKGSTQISEQLDPQELMEWVNDFMQAMARAVDEHGGYVDDYFGDGLKADFGVPIPRTREAEIDEDARSAVRCALAAARALDHINATHRQRGWPTIPVRIGIHTGEVVAGSLGSEERLKYTVVGDVVVTSARLESLDSVDHDFDKHPCRILISEQTRERLGEAFWTEPLGLRQLKGKDDPVAVHGVRGAASPGELLGPESAGP